ncbi:hypothetical protein N0Y54_32585 [Nostoc punctiforme UO1]|uniref:hypothetical protein n=1 Tax=Nostoc punctiforme TaxID=272131 RepID=UPI0030A7537B
MVNIQFCSSIKIIARPTYQLDAEVRERPSTFSWRSGSALKVRMVEIPWQSGVH